MSIPKVIHYCWFGKGKMPKLAKKCIKSWKKYCPDYKIICHNEDNFDLTQNRYLNEAYKAGKWAFVSDYVRLKIIYDNGGIYLDTDVELIKPIDDLLLTKGFMGFGADSSEISRQLAEGYRKIAEKHSIHFADTTDWGVELTNDGCHYTVAGHKRFAEKITEIINEIIKG